MKNFKQIILLFSFLGFFVINAQQVVKTDTISGNTLKITMNQKINDLMQNTEEKCSTNNKNSDSENLFNDHNSAPKINIPDRTMSTAEACRRNPRIMGYKILIATVKSNEEAKEVGLYFRGKYPSMKVEIDASLRPNYKIMAGSYFSKQSASSDFNSVKRAFKGARLISYRVFCVEAK